MATRTPTNVTTTPNWHYASARCAERTARSVSDEIAGHRRLATMTGVAWDGAAEAAAIRDSYYLLASAHRAAAHRMESGQRLRYRLSVLTHPAHKAANRVRRIRNERRSVNV
ncbi:hypothetical protein [Streptomyces sp. NPDC047868]|uniref:hypothetical protein n=1 Tax=Streptomyces sp. NPDC047868 TaxID=3155480 RepID=UPI003456F49B